MVEVLVTGGAGFIGSNFIKFALDAHPDWRITTLDKLTYAGRLENLESVKDNPRHTFVHGDVTDPVIVTPLVEQAEVILHLAAETHVDRSIETPGDFIQTNVVGTFELLETARWYWQGLNKTRQDSFRFLHVSTDEVYGSLGKTGLFTEQTAYAPNSPYAASKASSDHLVRAYHKTFNLPVLTTNCSNNYGPYQFPEKLLPLMITKALSGKPLPIYGDGKQIRDWLYVEDHCRAILEVLENGTVGQVYNIGGHNEKTNLEVVQTLCNILDEMVADSPYRPHKSLITFVEDRPGHDRRYAIDAGKIKKELGFEATHTIRDAAQDLCTAFKKGLLPNSLENEIYFNIKRMQSIKLS